MTARTGTSTGRTARSTTLRASLLLNLAAVIYLALLFRPRLPTSVRPAAVCPPSADVAATTPLPTCPVCRAASPAANENTEPEPMRVQRFDVCEHATEAAALSGLRMSMGANDLLAVHCGDSVEVLALDPAGPRRLLHVEQRSINVSLRWQTAPILAADVNGDGLSDLLIGFAAIDARGSPRGGALVELVRAADGGMAAPRALADLYVSGLSAGQLDGNAGSDIVVLHREDTRLGRQNQLVAFHGGPSPLKMLGLSAPDSARSVGLVDLDLDGCNEIILSSETESPEVLHLNAKGEVARRETLALPAATQLLIADMNGDGAPDAIFTGIKLWGILASKTQAEQPQVWLSRCDARQLTAIDVNRDGKLDLVGVQGNAVLAYVQSGLQHFATAPITHFPESPFLLDGAIALAGTTPYLALLAHSSATPTQPELAVLAFDSATQTMNWSSASTRVVDAPYVLRHAIP